MRFSAEISPDTAVSGPETLAPDAVLHVGRFSGARSDAAEAPTVFSPYDNAACTGTLWLGLDVGSTTVKAAVVNPATKQVMHSAYKRHFGRQAQTAALIIADICETLPQARFETAVCGSGAEPIANIIGAGFVQEVIAAAATVAQLYPRVQTCIELGGQDAKLLFFTPDERTGRSVLSDMRMNGCCAGGTGAFIDQIALLLGVPVEHFNATAAEGTTVFDISGRCGVFAKTDIQPLLNTGAKKSDLALSVFHAVARQIISGLAQGAEIKAPVLFAGGPFCFNRRLVSVFAELLGLKDDELFLPERPELLAAVGTALSLSSPDNPARGRYLNRDSHGLLAKRSCVVESHGESAGRPFFADDEERELFNQRHAVPGFSARRFVDGETAELYLGVDAGSTTIKFVLIDESGNVVEKFYAANAGDPLAVVRDALIRLEERFSAQGARIVIRGAATTGYGEHLMAQALGADCHMVETVAHARAAIAHVPDATFVLDMGGQDMKAMRISRGVISGVYLNEACSAGCGSFIETLARTLNVPLGSIADLAFKSKSPAGLGSRCTVFMNSSVTTAFKNGCSIEDIIAGLCRSVIENLFSKVIRVRDVALLGPTVVVQGGTFRNDAVLRAFEQYTGATVIRPPHPGEMGALGAALLAREHMHAVAQDGVRRSAFIGFDVLRTLASPDVSHNRCNGCGNRCRRTVVRFSTGALHVTGNRCEKGEVHSEESPAHHASERVACMVRFRQAALQRRYHGPAEIKSVQTVGIPFILEFYNSLPYWRTFFSSLGFKVVVSPPSDAELCARGIRYAASDTVCFPAKVAHGHVEHLLEKGVDRIFMPIMSEIVPPAGHRAAVNMCPVVQGYPVVLKEMDRPHKRAKLAVDSPAFRWRDAAMRRRQTVDFALRDLGVSRPIADAAVRAAEQAQKSFEESLTTEGGRILEWMASENRMGVVLAGRPYHCDPLINHGIPRIFSSLGIPVLTVDSIPGLRECDLSGVRSELYNPFHSDMYGAGLLAARHPNLEVVQLVSFSCGHDAVISDELCRIMRETSGKEPLILKIDEGEATGAIAIRIRSFVETVKRRRS